MISSELRYSMQHHCLLQWLWKVFSPLHVFNAFTKSFNDKKKKQKTFNVKIDFYKLLVLCFKHKNFKSALGLNCVKGKLWLCKCGSDLKFVNLLSATRRIAEFLIIKRRHHYLSFFLKLQTQFTIWWFWWSTSLSQFKCWNLVCRTWCHYHLHSFLISMSERIKQLKVKSSEVGTDLVYSNHLPSLFLVVTHREPVGEPLSLQAFSLLMRFTLGTSRWAEQTMATSRRSTSRAPEMAAITRAGAEPKGSWLVNIAAVCLMGHRLASRMLF